MVNVSFLPPTYTKLTHATHSLLTFFVFKMIISNSCYHILSTGAGVMKTLTQLFL